MGFSTKDKQKNKKIFKTDFRANTLHNFMQEDTKLVSTLLNTKYQNANKSMQAGPSELTFIGTAYGTIFFSTLDAKDSRSSNVATLEFCNWKVSYFYTLHIVMVKSSTWD